MNNQVRPEQNLKEEIPIIGEMPTISVVSPMFNELGNIEVLYERLTEVLSQLSVSYEMVFVDDGSTDGTLDVLKNLGCQDSRVRYVSLSRNFGHQASLLAGMSYARGNAVITMDADLQHPPSLIPELFRHWEAGNQVVYTVKGNYAVPRTRLLVFKTFYWVLSKISGLNLSFGQSDFRLLDRQVIDALLDIPEYKMFLRGIVDWMGFRQFEVVYDVPERHSGVSKESYRSRLPMAVDGILAFSSLPLRWCLATGMAIATLSIAYALVILLIGILSLAGKAAHLPPGWASLATAISFFGGVQLIAVGILGEYIRRIYDQSKGRPDFIVKECSSTTMTESDAAGRRSG